MTRVDRLRKDGWPECGTCGGTGKVDSSCSDQCDYKVACPDCVDGRVPSDGMVEMTVQIECPCGWIVRIPGWMAAYKAEQLVAAHRCELVEPAEGSE